MRKVARLPCLLGKRCWGAGKGEWKDVLTCSSSPWTWDKPLLFSHLSSRCGWDAHGHYSPTPHPLPISSNETDFVSQPPVTPNWACLQPENSKWHWLGFQPARGRSAFGGLLLLHSSKGQLPRGLALLLWNRTPQGESLRELETSQRPLPPSRWASLLSADHSPLCFTDLSSYNFSWHRSSRGLPCVSCISLSASASTAYCPVCSVSAQPSSAHVIFLGQAMSPVSEQSTDWLYCVTRPSPIPSVVAREISDCSPWFPWTGPIDRASTLMDAPNIL